MKTDVVYVCVYKYVKEYDAYEDHSINKENF